MFIVAPHMIYTEEQVEWGKREFYFSWEPRLVSYYRTNQWYQMQMTLHSGWAGASMGPMDWPYHMGFTSAVADDLRTADAEPWIVAAHLARFFQIRARLAQLANTDLPFDAPDPMEPDNLFRNGGMQSRADLLFKLAPTSILDTGAAEHQQTKYRALDDIQPGLHLMFVNASIALYNALYADTTADQYRRCDPNAYFGSEPEPHCGFRFCIDPERTPLPVDDQDRPYITNEWTTEQYLTWGILAATEMGAEPGRLATWKTWHDSLY